MARQRHTPARWKNLVLAVVVLAYMVCMLDVASELVVSAALMVARAVNGGLDATVINQTIAFLQEHINAYSATAYLIFFVPLLIWLLVMKRNDRRRERALTPEGELEAPDAELDAPEAVPVTSVSVVSDTPAIQTEPEAAEPQTNTSPRPAPANLPTVNFAIRSVDSRYFGAGALFGYGFQLVTRVIMILVAVLLPKVMAEYNTLVSNSGIENYGLMWVISTLILPPLVEETGFRGLGLTYLERAGLPFWLANIIQALAFGIFHMNLTQGLYTFALALVLGYLAHKSNSLVPGMVLHAVYNVMGTIGVSVIYGYLPSPFYVLMITSALALILAMRIVQKPTAQSDQSEAPEADQAEASAADQADAPSSDQPDTPTSDLQTPPQDPQA